MRQVVSPEDLGMIVSNIGATPDFSAIYTSNSAAHTAFVQVSLNDEQKIGSYEYMARVKRRIEREMPELVRLFPVRRPGGRSAESGTAGADRRAGGGLEHAALVRHGAATGGQDPQDSRSCRRVYSAGYRLSRAAARCRPDARGRTRARSARSGGQRDHGADFEPDDRAQLLDRSEIRQRLHADRAVSREPGAQHERPAGHPAARHGQPALDAVGCHHQHFADSIAYRGGSLSVAPHYRYLRAAPGRGSGPHRHFDRFELWPAPRCRRA